MSPTTRAYSFFARLQSHFNQTNKERNYLSALCSICALTTLIISLADHRWFWLNGGVCNAKYIGLNMFFTIGKLFVIQKANPWDSSAPMSEIYQFKSNDYTELIGCVNTQSILILRFMIILICLIILSSTIGFLLDAFGPMKYGLTCLRRYAFWHILSVFLCTLVIGLCFYVSEIIYEIQDRTRAKIGTKIEVQFGIGYYLLVASDGLLLLAIACTLLRKYPTREEEHFQRLVNDWSQREQPLLIERSSPAPIAVRNEPPPDYYSEDDFLVV